MREVFGIPSTSAPDDFDAGGSQAGFEGMGFGEPRSDERPVGDDGL